MRALVLHRRAHVVIVGGVVDVEVLLALRRVVRAGLEDADDQRLLHRQIQRLADGGRVGSEHPLPVGVGQHRHRRRRLPFVGRNQHPSELRPRAKELEEVRGDQSARRAMRLAAPQHVERPVAELDELVDRLRLRPIVGDFRKREVDVSSMPAAACGWRRCMIRSASGYGSGRRSTPLMTLKIAVLAPMPRPSVRMKASENPGILGRLRRAIRMSLIMRSSHKRTRRHLSAIYRSKQSATLSRQESTTYRRRVSVSENRLFVSALSIPADKMSFSGVVSRDGCLRYCDPVACSNSSSPWRFSRSRDTVAIASVLPPPTNRTVASRASSEPSSHGSQRSA